MVIALPWVCPLLYLYKPECKQLLEAINKAQNYCFAAIGSQLKDIWTIEHWCCGEYRSGLDKAPRYLTCTAFSRWFWEEAAPSRVAIERIGGERRMGRRKIR